MDRNTFFEPDPEVAAAIQKLVNKLLADGHPAVQVAFCLSATGLDLGLQLAPSPNHAFALVFAAQHQACLDHLLEGDSPDGLNDEASAVDDDLHSARSEVAH